MLFDQLTLRQVQPADDGLVHPMHDFEVLDSNE